MLTKAKLRELKRSWADNMADAEVGPMLGHIKEQAARISALEAENACARTQAAVLDAQLKGEVLDYERRIATMLNEASVSEAENARLTDLLRRTDADLQQARFHADQKWALRREVEELLGVADGPAGDEQFAAGVAALRSLVGIRRRLEARLREFEATSAGSDAAACLRGILGRQP